MSTEQALITDFINENQAALYRLAFSYARNREAALDIVQDTVVQAISHAQALRDREAVKPWVYRILVNESLAYLRRNKKIVFLDEYPERPAAQEDIGAKIDIYRAVERLEPKMRTVIVLRYFEDMKLEEIAKVTGANLNTVKARLYRALKRLRETLGCDVSLSEREGRSSV